MRCPKTRLMQFFFPGPLSWGLGKSTSYIIISIFVSRTALQLQMIKNSFSLSRELLKLIWYFCTKSVAIFFSLIYLAALGVQKYRWPGLKGLLFLVRGNLIEITQKQMSLVVYFNVDNSALLTLLSFPNWPYFFW